MGDRVYVPIAVVSRTDRRIAAPVTTVESATLVVVRESRWSGPISGGDLRRIAAKVL